MKEEHLLDLDHLVVSSFDLLDEKCGLSHGPYEKPEAIDYLTIPIGKSPDEISEVLKIPVCRECFNTLVSKPREWTVAYCLRCNNTAWISRQTSSISKKTGLPTYRHGLIMTTHCHECVKETDGRQGTYFFLEDEVDHAEK